MADSNTQLPPGAATGAIPDEQLFVQGLALGGKWAQEAAVRARAWAEENPGQFVIAGLAAGFILGKLLFRPQRGARFTE